MYSSKSTKLEWQTRWPRAFKVLEIFRLGFKCPFSGAVMISIVANVNPPKQPRLFPPLVALRGRAEGRSRIFSHSNAGGGLIRNVRLDQFDGLSFLFPSLEDLAHPINVIFVSWIVVDLTDHRLNAGCGRRRHRAMDADMMIC